MYISAAFLLCMYACVFDIHSLSHFLAIETEITRYADNATYCTTDRQLIIMHVCS